MFAEKTSVDLLGQSNLELVTWHNRRLFVGEIESMFVCVFVCQTEKEKKQQKEVRYCIKSKQARLTKRQDELENIFGC